MMGNFFFWTLQSKSFQKYIKKEHVLLIHTTLELYDNVVLCSYAISCPYNAYFICHESKKKNYFIYFSVDVM